MPVEVAPALHVYDVAPPAVNEAACPAQIVGELTVTTGIGKIVTELVVVEVQPPGAVTIWVMVYVPAVV
jgi:hypothetical protein